MSSGARCDECGNIGGRHSQSCSKMTAGEPVPESVPSPPASPENDSPVQPSPSGKRFRVNEVFYSLQGEGVRAGMPHVFVRFADCNLRCVREREGFDCDTEFSGSCGLDTDQLVSAIAALFPEAWRGGAGIGRVLMTGGEPALQLCDELLSAMAERRWRVSVETNGTLPLPSFDFDWIACSPKTAEHTLRIGRPVDELKYVRRSGQALPKPSLSASHYLISPAFGPSGVSAEDLKWCIDMVKDNPPWRLSVQQHKLWGVR